MYLDLARMIDIFISEHVSMATLELLYIVYRTYCMILYVHVS